MAWILRTSSLEKL